MLETKLKVKLPPSMLNYWRELVAREDGRGLYEEASVMMQAVGLKRLFELVIADNEETPA